MWDPITRRQHGWTDYSYVPSVSAAPAPARGVFGILAGVLSKPVDMPAGAAR